MNKKIIPLFIIFCLFTFSIITFSNKHYTYADDIVLGTYTTEFGEWDKPRTKNIKICANELDHTIIKSGQTFSFNDTVGDRTTQKGYEESTVFIYDEKVKGVGGGVCQVSTTLFNAAVYGNLEIVERHTHKREIYYAPNSRDATVSYPELDLKIKNNYPFDVELRVYTTGPKLTAEVNKI